MPTALQRDSTSLYIPINNEISWHLLPNLLSHTPPMYPSPAIVTAVLKCKYNHVTAGVTAFSSSLPHTEEKPGSPLSPIPAFLLPLPLHVPHWPGWPNFPSKHPQSSPLRYPTHTSHSIGPRLKLLPSLSKCQFHTSKSCLTNKKHASFIQMICGESQETQTNRKNVGTVWEGIVYRNIDGSRSTKREELPLGSRQLLPFRKQVPYGKGTWGCSHLQTVKSRWKSRLSC